VARSQYEFAKQEAISTWVAVEDEVKMVWVKVVTNLETVGIFSS
jgi:hypothetical protein